ncbi:DUF4291 domain-containing protein [Affinibrenneria salicis]|uniref:DUF4291 domain-containing protein n=1 Tax=Affinibrenneria salicis TaxID=2590031 RepID=A0A5J5G5B2_9GAMM|nr:DUF4291 domain-containing protein [Affinibrenneria salicis]KAA9002456.1 DUF4291 domain-containing protein [Affinibrenneria salicis]KAA9003256.1 DUF4291 domain-containing protein [Affinibrenneria salicis]
MPVSSRLTPERQIRAFYTKDFIRVYQAYSDAIADSALAHGTFVSPPFSMTRMTWIKPSFLWMMYRAGWGMKDPGQHRILAVDLTHEGFKQIVGQGVISHHAAPGAAEDADEWKKKIQQANVVIQWDPERDIHLNKLPYRTIQIGLRNEAVADYVSKWIVNISDISERAFDIHALIGSGRVVEATALLPEERVY